jgi:formylglycine-generating enzyme required for sulfatase activity
MPLDPLASNAYEDPAVSELPEFDPQNHAVTLLRRIDEAADRFEAAWANVAPPDLVDFVVGGSEEEQAALVAELARLDRQWRAKLAAPSKNHVGDDDAVAQDATVPGYEILEELGRGGMGVVYKARQIGLNRVVALKVVLGGAHAGTEELSRFRLEAEAVARLDHAHIVQIHEVGELQGRPFLALEFVDGKTLAEKLAHTPQPPRAAAHLIETLARAIHAAHERGIIHRDLKPANILLMRDGTPKISDFGLARQVDRDSAATTTGTILGSASYMAPEQARGESRQAGPAADVHSLGAILYEMLTGQPPFKGATALETIEQVCSMEPVAPRRLQPKVPRDLETICLKCLRKETGQRYPSASELADDLRRFLAGKPIVARPVRPWERVLKWIRRNPFYTAAIVLGFVLLGGAIYAEAAHQRQLQTTKLATQAAALVDELVSADAADVPRISEQLSTPDFRRWSDPLLEDRLKNAARDSKEWLHVALALSPRNEQLAESLAERLLTSHPEDVLVIRKSLLKYADQVSPKLWDELVDAHADINLRLRAACALALYEPASTRWRATDCQQLADQLVKENPLTLDKWSECLRPIRGRLVEPLLGVFRRADVSEASRFVATTLLVEYAHDQPDVLVQLATEADAGQFRTVFPALLANRERAIEALATIVARKPTAAGETNRIETGRIRAQAALALVRLGACEPALSVFHFDRDPEALSQFVVRVKAFEVSSDEVWKCLAQAPPDNTSARYGLLLSFGCFEWTDIPELLRPRLVALLRDWRRHDAKSSVHAACEWLLEKWPQADASAPKDVAADAAVNLPEYPLPGGREWFEMRVAEEALHFVVFKPQEFLAGSPASEPMRAPYEELHKVKLTRPFALLEQEVSMASWNKFLDDPRRERTQVDRAKWEERDKRLEKYRGPNFPAYQVKWDEAVEFCRWLTLKAGMTAADQCYEEVAATDAQRAWNFHPERRGFRLPTESEWEGACRGGTDTAYSFGSDPGLLPYFGVFLENTRRQPEPCRSKRPNPRGLFDMHGNVWNWCHDKKQSYAVNSDFTDPLGEKSGTTHAYRGGSYDNFARHSRCACRIFDQSDFAFDYVGFRVACTLAKPEDAEVK